MAINLHEKYAKQIQSAYVRESVVTGRLSNEYDFTGAKTVKISSPQTVPMNAYDRTAVNNRYGTPTEMQDSVQELTLTQDRSFALTIDKGNNADQSGTKAAGRMLALQIAERAVPEMDTYVLKTLAEKAGVVVGSDTALTKSNVVSRIAEGTQHMDDAEVPCENRTLFVSAATYKLIRLSDEYLKADALAQQALEKGVVGMFDGMKVVKVPEKRWPKNLNFMIVHKAAACAPVKLNDTKLHIDPPGLSGNLLEGREYYDCFVFAAKCDGVYAEVDTAAGAEVCAMPTESGGVFASATAGCSFKYTVDGSDPRYSASAKAADAENEAAGTVIKVAAFKEGAYPSAVLTYTA